jgi:hypothetical protein
MKIRINSFLTICLSIVVSALILGCMFTHESFKIISLVFLLIIVDTVIIICVYALYWAIKKRLFERSSIAKITLQRPEIFKVFSHLAKEDNPHVSQEQWDEAQRCIDVISNNFTKRLYELYSHLSVQELHMCYLIKMGIPPSGISKLLFRSKSAITMSRTRLYKKMFGTEGSSEMFDEFIARF